jgi:hypothetical protein
MKRGLSQFEELEEGRKKANSHLMDFEVQPEAGFGWDVLVPLK